MDTVRGYMINIVTGNNHPIYMQIYEYFKKQILSGQLAEGQKLPSTRFLARDLSIGRNTVENAYGQLVSEGYIESKQGSGFCVSKISTTKVVVPKKSEKRLRKPTEKMEPYRFNFLYGSMAMSPFPKTAWRRALIAADAQMGNMAYTSYGHQQGEWVFRKNLCDYIKTYRGLEVIPEQLLICAGVEYALTLLSQLFRQMGIKTVAIEEPGYKGARDFLLHHGIKVVPITVGPDGIDIELLKKSKAQAVYVTPSHQFPTGAVMPISKRQALLAWARENGHYIIEDDYDSELRYNSRPIPSIGSISGGEHVIYIGTFSKAFSPSIRVSYMSLPEKILACYLSHFVMYQCSVPTLIQLAINQLLEQGQYETHLRKLNVANKRKHQKLVGAIKQHLADKVMIHGGQAGIHLLIEICDGEKEEILLKKAQSANIILMPASPFWYNQSIEHTACFIIAIGNIVEEDIEAGIIALAKAWQ